MRKSFREIMMMAFAFGIAFVSSSPASALPAPLQVRAGKFSLPVKSGVLVGGQSGNDYSLIGVQTESATSDSERLILVYGDRYGNTLRHEPGYFHVTLDRNARRLVIDLAQVNKTAVDPIKLSRILLASKFVASSEMTMDPFDGSTNITLNLKEPARMKVLSDESRQARVVIELERALTAPVREQ